MVYVLNKDGKPLMPTARLGKVRHLLNEQKAIIVSYQPFTIQLTYDCPNRVQEVSLGVDAGSKHVGLSATTKKKVLFEAQLELRDDIVGKLATRKEYRSNRRYRKTRYRKPRFLNRTKAKTPGGVAPSIRQKIDSHIYWIDRIYSFLPIVRINVEIAQFDTQLLKAQDNNQVAPQGIDYQRGEQMGFWNVREYVLFRDGYKCQCCKGTSKDPILNVHHIESRKTGGNAPNNLVTLCETCHKSYHLDMIQLPTSIKRGQSYRGAAFMGIMRWKLMNTLKEKYGNIVSHTYGYITKHTRIANNFPKEHTVDARCISGNPRASVSDGVYYIRKIRCHNRQLHKAKILKGGIRKSNQALKYVFGFRLWDIVFYHNVVCIVSGRRTHGDFHLQDIRGNSLGHNVWYKHLIYICHSNSNLILKDVPHEQEKDK